MDTKKLQDKIKNYSIEDFEDYTDRNNKIAASELIQRGCCKDLPYKLNQHFDDMKNNLVAIAEELEKINEQLKIDPQNTPAYETQRYVGFYIAAISKVLSLVKKQLCKKFKKTS